MGDPACWLHALCDECGRVIGEDHRGPCPHCDAPTSNERSTVGDDVEEHSTSDAPAPDHGRSHR